MSDQLLPSQPTGRAHSFVFVNDVLPSFLFDDRERFVDCLRGPGAQSALETLWRAAGTEVVARATGASLPATGLSAEAVDGNGWRGVVIQMPKVEEIGECSLVLMIVPNHPVTGHIWQLYEKKGAPLARLFVLKLLQSPRMDTPEFKICELSPVLGRVTTGYTCAGNAVAFVREVVDCLEVE